VLPWLISTSSAAYHRAYEDTVGRDLAELYHVPDTWETFDGLKALLDRRFAKWSKGAS
jgi:hypothetical protein